METLVKLSKIQGELKAPKSQRNSFGKYNYRSCEDILEAVKPLLAKYGACLVLEDEPVQSGEYHYIKATATIYDSESGDKISNTAYAREPKQQSGMSDSQLTGTASSYARKYALNGLFCIRAAVRRKPTSSTALHLVIRHCLFPSGSRRAA